MVDYLGVYKTLLRLLRFLANESAACSLRIMTANTNRSMTTTVNQQIKQWNTDKLCVQRVRSHLTVDPG